MNDLRKAAQLALEALEDVFGLEKKDVGAINALRQALAKPEISSDFDWIVRIVEQIRAEEREACAVVCDELAEQDKLSNYYAVASKAIRERGEKPAVKTYCGGKPNYCTTQEPEYVIDCPRCGHCCPERKWAGLTDDDIWEGYSKTDSLQYVAYAKAIEAKLKEKNT